MKQAPWLLASPGSVVAGASVSLDAAEARHACGALRLHVGDAVVLTDGAGVVAAATLTLVARRGVEAAVNEVHAFPAPTASLTLAMSVLAGPAMDLVVQKSVELGAERLLPVCSHRSQLGLDRATERTGHWRRVGRQALKQCHRPWAMEVAAPVAFHELVSGLLAESGVVGHPEGLPVSHLPVGRGGVLLIGPEGGFASVEERALEDAGWLRVSLGPYVLRAETAAIAGIALLGSRLEVVGSRV